MGCYNNIYTEKSCSFKNKKTIVRSIFFFAFILFNYNLIAQVCQGLTAEARVENASCGVNNDGAIYLSVQGGTTPYTYQWNNGTKLKDLTGAASGDYTITVKDADGCQISLNYAIEAENPFHVDFSVQAPTTQNVSDGRIDLSVSGGVPPYIFFINDYSDIRNIKRYSTTQSHIEGLDAGNYLIDVKDARGCIATLPIHLKSQTR